MTINAATGLETARDCLVDTAPTRGEVSEALGRLRDKVDLLERLVDEAFNRFAPACRPPEAAEESATVMSARFTSPLADMIDVSVDRLRNLADTLAALTARCEL